MVLRLSVFRVYAMVLGVDGLALSKSLHVETKQFYKSAFVQIAMNYTSTETQKLIRNDARKSVSAGCACKYLYVK